MLTEDLAVAHFAAGTLGERLSYARLAQAVINITQLHVSGWEKPHL